MGSAARIRIGNQTAASASYPAEPFEYAVAHGFDAFEWFPDKKADGSGWDESEITPAMRASVRRVAREHDISLSVHGSWHATPLTAAGRRQLTLQAEFAAEIGAAMFVLHPFREEGFDRYVDQIAPLVALLAGHAIRVAIENTPDMSPRDMNALLRGARSGPLRAQGVGMCLDLGHANLCGETRNDYLGYLDSLAPATPLSHLHLHENWGDEDAHLTIFTGPAGRDGAAGVKGLASRLAGRNFSGCIILEQWPRPPQLLDAARDRLIEILAVKRTTGATSASLPHS